MKLIKSKDGFNIEVNDELYAISEFASLLEARKDKKLLLKEIAYIYFCYDLSSDFQFQTNKLIRQEDVKRYVGLPNDWKPDKLVNEAIDAFNYLSTTLSTKLLKSVYNLVNKIEKQLEDIDLNERDKMGRPIWNLKQIQDIANKLPDVFASIDKAEKQYIKSQEDTSKLRGTKLKSMYEDGYVKE